MDRVALDTTFLIDLQNERRGRGAPRGATAFLTKHPATELLLPAVALGEYLEGFDDPDSEAARGIVSALRVVEINHESARLYARVARALRSTGRLIGTNDLWIACTARAIAVPIVTRNPEHFSRVPELEVIAYRE